MNTIKNANSVKMTLFCLATWAMAMTATDLTAQIFTTLYSFDGSSDGAYPWDALILSGNTLYGTAAYGGSGVGTAGYGIVFRINTDGADFKNLYNFTGERDGVLPVDKLILSGTTLYGTASGGIGNAGAVFAVKTNGTCQRSLKVYHLRSK